MDNQTKPPRYWESGPVPRTIKLGKSPMTEHPQEAHIDNDGDLVIGEHTWLTPAQARRLARFIDRHFGYGAKPQ